MHIIKLLTGILKQPKYAWLDMIIILGSPNIHDIIHANVITIMVILIIIKCQFSWVVTSSCLKSKWHYSKCCTVVNVKVNVSNRKKWDGNTLLKTLYNKLYNAVESFLFTAFMHLLCMSLSMSCWLLKEYLLNKYSLANFSVLRHCMCCYL